MNVLIFRQLPPPVIDSLRERVPGAHIRVCETLDGLDDELDWAEIVFGNPPAARLKGRPRLRWLQIVSSGFDEYTALAGTPVTLTTARGAHAQAIAQQLMMAMLMFARGQLHFGACQLRRIWDRNPAIPFGLRGQVVGFVGYGTIAREFARLCAPCGLRLRAVRRNAGERPPELETVDTASGLEALLRESDHVILTAPYTAESRGMIDAARVGSMKRGAYFYNVARGGLVDEAALMTRLREGSLGGAAMDVFEREPLPADSPWWETPNTLIFPHIAGHHRDLNLETFAIFADNLERYAAGQPLRNVADFNRGY